MKVSITMAVLIMLTGCGSVPRSIYNPHWLAENFSAASGPNNYRSTTVVLPQGHYTVISNTQGSQSTVQVYKATR